MNRPALITSPRHVGDDPDWWRRAVVYQIYPRSFPDPYGAGGGVFGGAGGRRLEIEGGFAGELCSMTGITRLSYFVFKLILIQILIDCVGNTRFTDGTRYGINNEKDFLFHTNYNLMQM